MSRGICLISALFSLIPAALAGPGDSVGGGSTVRCNGQTRPFLLDRLYANPKLADQKEVVTSPISRPTIDAEKQPEISSLLSSDKAAFDIAIRKLQAWEQRLSDRQPASKALMRLLTKTIEGTNYKRTAREFNEIARYKLPQGLKGKCVDVNTAILYLPLYGCVISAPIWDGLDAETQAGLIIHESLRQLQGLHGFSDLTDEQIQSITASIMDREPSADFSFEPWMSEKLARLCGVSAVADRDCISCRAAALPQQNFEWLAARIAVDFNREIDAHFDQRQKERSQNLSSPEELERVLSELLKKGILKRK